MKNKEGDFRARLKMNPRREMLGFAHREVARNHENSFFFTQLS